MNSKMRSSAINVGNRCYSIASLNDEDFDLILYQKNVVDVAAVKSFVDYDDQLIVVREKLSSDHKQELVLHELIHACLEDAGNSQVDVVEEFVTILAPRLSALLSSGLIDVLNDVVL